MDLKKREKKNGNENEGNIVTTKVSKLDENDIDKKSSPLEATFVKPEEKPPEKLSFFKLFRFATKLDYSLIFIALLGAVVSGGGTIVQTKVYGSFTNDMTSYGTKILIGSLTPEEREELDEGLIKSCQNFAIYFCAIGIATLIGSYLSTIFLNYSALRQTYIVRGLYYRKTLNQEIGWFDMNDCGEFASRMTSDLVKFEDGIGEKIAMYLHHQVAFVGSYILAFLTGWELALICMISLPVTMILMYSVMKIVVSYSVRESVEYAKAGAIAEEVLSGIRTVLAFGGEKKEFDRYSGHLVYAKKNNIKKNFFTGLAFGILWFIIYASYALSFYAGVRFIQRDENPYTIEAMITVFFAIMMGNMNFGISSPYLESFAGACGSAARVFSIIDRKPKIDTLNDNGIVPEEIKGSITFKNIHFTYPSRPDVQILKGLNLTINKGETVALVGKSGCGKSTCIQLTQRLYDPESGIVELDGVDIRTLKLSWLRKQIGVVGQEPVLFSTSIAENIRYGNSAATQEDIEAAAKKANAHEFITQLPNGYKTLVGERGAQMSGGQKQRIAIARALVRDPAILLLDEATSALDTNSEAKVQRALDRASQGRTTIIVAHRLSTIRGADKIVVVADGQVAEQGTHDELLAMKGHYHSLVMAQVGGEEEPDTFDDTETVNFKSSQRELISRQMSKISSISSDSRQSQTSLEQVVTDLDEVDYDSITPETSMLEILKYNAPEWPVITIACIGSCFMGCAMPIFSILFGDILGDIALPDKEEVLRSTNISCLLFLGLGVVAGLAIFLQQYMFGIAGEKLTLRLRELGFSAMLKQEAGWFDDPKRGTGVLCAQLSSEASAVQGATGSRIGTILQACSTIVLAVSLSLYYEWRIGLLALAFAPLLLIAAYLEQTVMHKQNESNKSDIERSAKLAVETVSNIRTVVSLGREKIFYEEYISLLLPSFITAKRNVHFRGLVFGLSRSIVFFAYGACMLYGGHLITTEDLSFQVVFQVSQALIMGTVSIGQAFAFAPNFQKGIQAAGRIFHLLNRKPKVQNYPGVRVEDWECKGEVDYQNVYFRYPTRPDTQVLRNLSLAIHKGQTVALVGPSGCGKSTIIQLLERFYDPGSGSIAIDKRSLQEDLSLETLRRQLGIVSQEPVLFDRTIQENIAYGDNTKEVSKADVIAAAKKANIHNFIVSLPLGYDTKMGDKGTQLSGGQKQRVAIARALVRNPKILLLDEATSALDTESEQVVQDALDKAREGRTCITIAHRLTTIQDADVIFVINRGRVAEIGTHHELLEEKGIYYKLHQLQTRKLD